MNARQTVISNAVKEHVARIMKSAAYPAVWSHVPEATMNTAITQVTEEVGEAVSRDPTITETIDETELFTTTGKLNAMGIYHAIVQASQSMQEPMRTKMQHLAKNAEIVFRSARLFKEPTP